MPNLHRPELTLLLMLGLLVEPARPSASAADQFPLGFTVRAGEHDRRDSLIRFAIPAGRFGSVLKPQETTGVIVTDAAGVGLSMAQVARRADGSFEATCFLPEPIPAGQERRYKIADQIAAVPPWSVAAANAGQGRVEIRHRERPVLRYNAAPVASPRPDPEGRLTRAGYIHPAYSPTGALITGDFSPFHPHHRGFFLAYTHTRWGDLTPDFWNIQAGTGRIAVAEVEPAMVGPISVRFEARHRWEAIQATPTGSRADEALRERWQVELFDVPGTPYWLVDLTSTQQAVGHPLELLPYRYGGMAYRSAEPSVNAVLDVLTAEGRHRFDGDQKPTRWVDLTGPIEPGSPKYAGAMIADHPSNPRYPNIARIHPITLPFFSYVPAQDQSLTIATGEPTRFRYRIMIHDGRPDSALNDRIAADFVDPPEVVVRD